MYLSLLGLLMFGLVSWMQYRFVFWQRGPDAVRKTKKK
jgi:NitT/TauT family transport system permease protein